MTQAERDRLVALKKAKKRLITRSEAASELEVSERQVRRLLRRLREAGDRSVIHGLKGRVSARRIDESIRREAIRILSAPVYQGFGPTLASEYLSERHGILVSRETLRQWMAAAKLWRPKNQRQREVHVWRPRRSRYGELVQWDTSEHDWLEGRGGKLYLIAMIDDATSRLFARFAAHDSTEENMRLLWSYLEKFGRPLAFYTDKASLFRTTEKHRRDEPGVEKDPVEMPPTQIGRALQELGIAWIGAHSPQAKGRIERNFGTAQDRLIKGMRVAGVKTIDEANRYLEDDYLVWWERELTVEPASHDDAHRALDKSHNLMASLSHVEARQIRNDHTFRWSGGLYRIDSAAIVSGMRGSAVRVESRLDGSMAVRYADRYLPVSLCEAAGKKPARKQIAGTAVRGRPQLRGSEWQENFDLKKAPKVWQAALASGYRQSVD